MCQSKSCYFQGPDEPNPTPTDMLSMPFFNCCRIPGGAKSVRIFSMNRVFEGYQGTPENQQMSNNFTYHFNWKFHFPTIYFRGMHIH